MLADQRDHVRHGRAVPGNQTDSVTRIIQCGADVVAHTTVDADIGTQPGQFLDRPDLIQCDRARTADGPARFDRQPRDGEPGRCTLLADDRAEPVGDVRDIEWRVLAGVGDPQAAAEIELGQFDTVGIANDGQQPHHTMGGQPESGGVEYLRTDVRVRPDELKVVGRGQHPSDRLGRRAAGEREAELLVLLPGGHIVVGVGLHSRSDPDEHSLTHAGLRGHRRQAGDLHERVDDDPPDAVGDRPPQLGDGLVVAVEEQPFGWKTHRLRNAELTARADIQREPFGGDPSGNRTRQQRLTRVVDIAVGESRPPCPATRPEVIGVQDVGGRGELGRERVHPQPADPQHTVGVHGCGRRPQRVLQLMPALGGRNLVTHNSHILVGADTPSSRRPFARTILVASARSSRAPLRAPACSSPCGSTRQASWKR